MEGTTASFSESLFLSLSLSLSSRSSLSSSSSPTSFFPSSLFSFSSSSLSSLSSSSLFSLSSRWVITTPSRNRGAFFSSALPSSLSSSSFLSFSKWATATPSRKRGVGVAPFACHISSSSSSLMGGFFELKAGLLARNELLYDLGASVVTTCVAMASLKFFQELAKRDLVNQKVNRKLVHISIGLIFMLFWPLFSDSPMAPYLAAFAPAVNGLRMLLLGFGLLEDKYVVKSMSREGDPRELLKGPFYYATAISIATAVFWRTSPIGPLIIANLCAGDGFADLVGRHKGKEKLLYNKNKSYMGSLAMLCFGFLFTLLYLFYFGAFGFMDVTGKTVLLSFVATLVSTVVESLPVSTKLDDNLTVPLTACLLGSFLFSF